MAFRGTGSRCGALYREPGAGSDVGSLKTTYTRKNGKGLSPMAVMLYHQ